MHTNSLALSGPAAEAFGRLDPILETFLGPGYASLSGGINLAARWGHRHTNHLELVWWSPYVGERMRDKEDRLREALERTFRDGAPEVSYVRIAGSLGPDATVDMKDGLSPDRPEREKQYVPGSTVTWESVACVLDRKIGRRMYEEQRYEAEDLFDWLAAHEHAPQDVQRICTSMSTSTRGLLSAELDRHWQERRHREQGLDKEVRNASWRTALAEEPGRMVRETIMSWRNRT